MYWLKTRFYDPETGRFISPDGVEYLDPETLGGINLYAYCNNNPVMNVDPDGTAFLSILIGLGIAALIGATVGGASYAVSGFSLFEQPHSRPAEIATNRIVFLP